MIGPTNGHSLAELSKHLDLFLLRPHMRAPSIDRLIHSGQGIRACSDLPPNQDKTSHSFLSCQVPWLRNNRLERLVPAGECLWNSGAVVEHLSYVRSVTCLTWLCFDNVDRKWKIWHAIWPFIIVMTALCQSYVRQIVPYWRRCCVKGLQCTSC